MAGSVRNRNMPPRSGCRPGGKFCSPKRKKSLGEGDDGLRDAAFCAARSVGVDRTALGGFVESGRQFDGLSKSDVFLTTSDGCANAFLLILNSGNDRTITLSADDSLTGAFCSGFGIGHKRIVGRED